jgi:hypothetical protein
MEIREFLALVVPFIIVIYLGFLLFIRPTRPALLASLLGGLVMGLINVLVDLVAYYAGWWYYNLNGLTLHVPLPFYITPVLVYGSIVYLLIWRFWIGRGRWFALLLLFGVPVFCILRDILGMVANSSYIAWKSPLAAPVTIIMWLVGFYAGFLLFQRLAPPRPQVTWEVEHKKDEALEAEQL